MVFSYLRRWERDYPIIPVELRYRGRGLLTEGLVDSGANLSVFSADIADYLGLPLTRGKALILQGVGGRILGYQHTLKLKVGTAEFRLPICFSAELVTSFNLLGREGFFQKFRVTFDEGKKRLFLR